MIYTTTTTTTTRLSSEQPPTPEQLARALREAPAQVTCEPYTLSLKVEPVDYVDDFYNPRDWDHTSTMACFHRSYTLGDENDYRSDDYDNWDEMEEAIKEGSAPDCILPLSLYDHSGLSMSVGRSSGWDSGQVGFIFGTCEEGETPEQLEARLRYEVDLYDRYIRGEIYQFTVVDSLGEVLESCTGFFSEEDARADGEAALKTCWEYKTDTVKEGAPIQKTEDN